MNADVVTPLVGGMIVLVFGAIALYGERWQRALEDRRLRRHKCPAECEESGRCRCGCGGLTNFRSRQENCAVCGTRIMYPEERRANEVTQEMPAPKGFTSWGWERDREFRKARRDMGGRGH